MLQVQYLLSSELLKILETKFYKAATPLLFIWLFETAAFYFSIKYITTNQNYPKLIYKMIRSL